MPKNLCEKDIEKFDFIDLPPNFRKLTLQKINYSGN